MYVGLLLNWVTFSIKIIYFIVYDTLITDDETKSNIYTAIINAHIERERERDRETEQNTVKEKDTVKEKYQRNEGALADQTVNKLENKKKRRAKTHKI